MPGQANRAKGRAGRENFRVFCRIFWGVLGTDECCGAGSPRVGYQKKTSEGFGLENGQRHRPPPHRGQYGAGGRLPPLPPEAFPHSPGDPPCRPPQCRNARHPPPSRSAPHLPPLPSSGPGQGNTGIGQTASVPRISRFPHEAVGSEALGGVGTSRAVLLRATAAVLVVCALRVG